VLKNLVSRSAHKEAAPAAILASLRTPRETNANEESNL
jgi:hypothetical protein